MTDNNSILPKRRGLGRGLDALFEDTEVRAGPPNADHPQRQAAASAGAAPSTPTGRAMMPITQLVPGAYQPRHVFDDQTIHELAKSIAQHGIIQPLLVRPHPTELGQFEIIAGERRWRAAQKAGLHDVPVVVNGTMTDREALQLGLIENLQREDLNGFDEAAGYQRLIDEFHFTPERLGEMIGKSRAHVANTLRLLQLAPELRTQILAQHVSMGHARALIGVPTPDVFLKRVIDEKLSVRQLEKIVEGARREAAATGVARPVRTGGRRKDGAQGSDAAPEKDMHVLALEDDVTRALGLKVRLEMTPESGAGAGTMHIQFRSLDQLDDLLRRLKRG